MRYDVKRDLPELYAPKNRDWAVLDVPEQHFLAIDGAGNPNIAPAYRAAVEALYSVAYTLKFTAKQAGRDFVVAPLEGLWWADDYDAFLHRDKDAWQWTMLISQPAWITADEIIEARDSAVRKKRRERITSVYHHRMNEGRSVQALHIGSYDDEEPLLDRLHNAYLDANALTPNGLHHEIYLGDPRRSAPERLKTVLRQPVRSK